MDKYEFNIKVEQIKKLMKKKDFITAVKIADTIDWEKVKENQLLIMAADVYEIAGKYDAAREALLLAYEKTGLGRQLAYRLCRLSVKRGDISEAEEFYQEFTQNSPRDAGKYILQYEMAKGRGESIEKQIEILEAYIEEDMDDRWAYELAKLYHKAHLRDKCVEQCDTIILWFADGKYVEKALELKQLYVPLSENQRLKYEAQKSRKTDVRSDMIPQVSEVEEVATNTESNIEENIGASIENAMGTTADTAEESEETETAVEENANEESKSTYVEKQNGDILDEVHEADIDVNSIHVKDFSVNNKYDTVNLQKELAQSVRSLFDNTIEVFKPTVRRETPVEEPVEDDQIEGQMSLEEVLAMFESGELQTRKEPKEAVATEDEVAGVESTDDESAIDESVVEIFAPEVVEAETDEIAVEELVSDEIVTEDIGELTTDDIQSETMEVSEEVSFGDVEDMEIEELEDIEDEEEIEAEAEEDFEESELEELFEETDNEMAEVDEMNEDEEIEPEEVAFDDGFGDNSSEEEMLAEIIAREIQIDISEEVEEIVEDQNEDMEDDIEELLEESSEEGSENEVDEDSEDNNVETEVAEEEDSEEAESEIQESMPVMFDLKDDSTEDNDVEQASEVEEAVEMNEENTEESAEGTMEDDSDDDLEESDTEKSMKDDATEESDEEKKTAQVTRPVIQSETAKEELKNFIARFSGVQGLDKQILKVMQNTLKVEKEPVKFIFVKGEVKSGKTTLAIEVLKLANKIMQRRDQKIAKIKAESINGKSVEGLLGKLNGSDVLIERVSDMESDTFVEFIDKLKAEGKERFVIFEDEKSLADAFLEKVPAEYREFANMLDIKQNKIKDWTKMASDYAKKNGYAFDEMGILALSAKIDQLRAITLVVHKNHVEQLVDGAIKKSNRFGFRKLFGRAKDENGLILLTEKDFID